MKKVLYVSSFHPTLEYDELRILEELGLDWFSTGIYINPQKPIGCVDRRGPLPKEPNYDLINLFLKDNPQYHYQCSATLARPQVKLSKDLVSQFDIILIVGYESNYTGNYSVLKDKQVFWREYDALPVSEANIHPFVLNNQVSIIRYMDNCRGIKINGGYVIPPYVEKEVYDGWLGDTSFVLAFQSYTWERQQEPATQFFLQGIMKVAPCALYGDFAEVRHPLCRGKVSFEQQKLLYKKCKAYFTIPNGTNVAYMYSQIEAMMTGCPVLTVGKNLSSDIWKGEDLYNGSNGLATSDIKEAVDWLQQIFSNRSFAEGVSQNSRTLALKHFSKEQALNRWREVLTI